MLEKEQLRSFLDEFLKYYPDPYGLVAKSYTADFLVSLGVQPYQQLIVIADALAQFVAHIRFYGNQKHSELSVLKSQFEKQLALTVSDISVQEKITDRTPRQFRFAKALKANPKLSDLYDHITEIEKQARLYDYMPDAIREHLNIIKLEIRTRQEQRNFD